MEHSKIMKLLINDKEIAHYLSSLLDPHQYANEVNFNQSEIAGVINYIVIEKAKKKYHVDRMRQKFKDKIRAAVIRDVKRYSDTVKSNLTNRKKYNLAKILKRIDFLIDHFGIEKLLDAYQTDKKQNFVKSVGFHIDPRATMIRRSDFSDYNQDCLIRNTVGNEELLISKIDNNNPFWFIDSGYTNFLEPNKKWHRLVRNHLHQGEMLDVPVDRLGGFKSFPKQWREGGEKILVIEPGRFAAGIFHVDLNTWKYKVEEELRKYTDRPIVFREKAPKKTRQNLFKHLLDEDYYCVVNINSNAATEAVWAGVPVITLDKHITNPISRSNLSDINDLLRPNLASWLCTLSYSQFTYDELVDGTAVKILRKYYG